MTDIIKFSADSETTALVPAADGSSTEMLRTIKAVEEHLRAKRSKIEELQSRRDDLVEEMRQLKESLESESLDFVANLKAVIGDLDAGGAVVTLQPVAPAATAASDPPAGAAERGEPAGGRDEEKPGKRSSLRWLKDKDR